MHFFETYLSASTLQHHHFVKCSNIRGRITDLTRQTYEDVRFDKSRIRDRIFEYSGLTESEFRSLEMGGEEGFYRSRSSQLRGVSLLLLTLRCNYRKFDDVAICREISYK